MQSIPVLHYIYYHRFCLICNLNLFYWIYALLLHFLTGCFIGVFLNRILLDFKDVSCLPLVSLSVDHAISVFTFSLTVMFHSLLIIVLALL